MAGDVWLVVVAVWAEQGGGFLDPMEVFVEGNVAGAGLDEEGSVVSREGSGSLQVFVRWGRVESRDWHGHKKPAGFWPGFAGVGVRVTKGAPGSESRTGPRLVSPPAADEKKKWNPLYYAYILSSEHQINYI